MFLENGFQCIFFTLARFLRETAWPGGLRLGLVVVR